LERETGPFIVLRVGTGPEICRFIPLWAAKVGADRTIACPIEKKGCFGGRVFSEGGSAWTAHVRLAGVLKDHDKWEDNRKKSRN